MNPSSGSIRWRFQESIPCPDESGISLVPLRPSQIPDFCTESSGWTSKAPGDAKVGHCAATHSTRWALTTSTSTIPGFNHVIFVGHCGTKIQRRTWIISQFGLAAKNEKVVVKNLFENWILSHSRRVFFEEHWDRYSEAIWQMIFIHPTSLEILKNQKIRRWKIPK